MHSDIISTEAAGRQRPRDLSKLLVLCGTAPFTWGPLAQHVAEAVRGVGHEVHVAQDIVQSAWMDDEGARFVAFIDPLDRCLALSAPDDPERAVLEWAVSVRAVLSLARARPARWCLVDTDEVARSPQALADHLLRFDVDVPELLLSDLPVPLALRHLAARIMSEHAGIRQLQEEVYASCVPLTDGSVAEVDSRALWHSAVQDRAELLARDAELAATRAQLRHSQITVDRLERDHARVSQTAGQEAAALSAQLRLSQLSMESEHRRAEQLREEVVEQAKTIEVLSLNLAAADKEAQALRSALQLEGERHLGTQRALETATQRLAAADKEAHAQRSALQVESERHSATQRALETATQRLAALEADLKSAEAGAQARQRMLDQATEQFSMANVAWDQVRIRHESERMQLLERLHAAQESLIASEHARQGHIAEHEAERARASADQQALRAEIHSLQRQQAASSLQQSQMLVQMHHVQEALEDEIVQGAKLRDELRLAHDEIGPQERAAAIHVEGVSDSAPHLHVDLRLEGVRIGSRRIESVQIRLVEHAGHPGLLFWGGASSELSAWVRSGEEDGRPFMLLIPESDHGVSTLQRLGSRDWTLVLGLARVLQRCFQDRSPELKRWAAVAARIVRSLEAMPSRLRYDALRVQAFADGAMKVSFEGSQFGERDLGTIDLRWWPVARRLEWIAPGDLQHLALASWPVLSDGQLAPAFELPVGAAGSERERRERWAEAPAADQIVMLALLDALPGTAAVIGDSVTNPPISTGALEQAALALHKEARRTLRALRLRALSRRWLPGAEAR